MPEPSRFAEGLAQTLGLALSLAALAVLIVFLRILMLDEAASDRARLLLLVVGCGAFLAAIPSVITSNWLKLCCNRWMRGGVASLLFTALFVPATMGCFALQIRLIEGNLEPGALEDGRLREIVLSIVGAMGLFLPTGMRYLLPWSLPALLASAFILFLFWPDHTGARQNQHQSIRSKA